MEDHLPQRARLDRRAAARVLERQHGVLSRDQVLAMGITGSGLKHRVRPGGPWQRILPATYLTFTGTVTQEQLEMAAHLYAGPASVLSGPAALRKYWIRGPETSRVDVLVRRGCSVPSRDFVAIHRTRRIPDTVFLKGAVPLVSPARAVLDTVTWLRDPGDARAVVAGAVQAGRCTLAELEAELQAGPRRNTALLRAVLTEIAAGVRSAPEGDLRSLIMRQHLPMPMFNPRLYLDSTFLASPDAWWPAAGVAVEVDSVEFHYALDDWQHTLRRHRRMTAAGILVLHVTPRQLREEPTRIAADIAAALARGQAPAGVTAQPAAA
jgi:hypothetical protein